VLKVYNQYLVRVPGYHNFVKGGAIGKCTYARNMGSYTSTAGESRIW
jgi:hypothetical protein